jgi:hypothetical protein
MSRSVGAQSGPTVGSVAPSRDRQRPFSIYLTAPWRLLGDRLNVPGADSVPSLPHLVRLAAA